MTEGDLYSLWEVPFISTPVQVLYVGQSLLYDQKCLCDSFDGNLTAWWFMPFWFFLNSCFFFKNQQELWTHQTKKKKIIKNLSLCISFQKIIWIIFIIRFYLTPFMKNPQNSSLALWVCLSLRKSFVNSNVPVYHRDI